MRRFLFFLFRWMKRLAGGRYGRGFASAPAVGPLFQRAFATLKPRGIALTNYRGMPLYADADDPAHAPLFLGAEYNDPEIEAAQKRLKPGMTAVDIGANIGCFALAMARAVGPTGRVYAFEPMPKNLETLRKNCALNKASHVVIEPKAVGERGGTATLSVEEQTGVAEPILTKKKAPGEHQTAEAEMVALDGYFGDSPPRVDFVKMDIQGFEAAALRGMKRLLEANPQMEMIVELDPERLTACGEDPTRFLRELTGHGFSLFHVSHARKARERLRPVSPEEALSACADEGRHINLYCAR